MLVSKYNGSYKISILSLLKCHYFVFREKTNFVHMTDLENAIHYMLYQEVGVVSHLYGERLRALQSFISALKNVSLFCIFVTF